MMLLVKSGGEKALAEWQAEFAAAAPQLEVRSWSDPDIDPAAVSYVLVWEPEHGRLAQLPNLRLICSSAAGVDHILADPNWPRHLSIVRMAAAETAQRMSEFVCLGALSLLRDMKRIITQQAACHWDEFETPRCAPEVTAGVMGLGNLGAHAAQTLQALGFQVAGWSRTPKDLPGIRCFAGAGELDAFLGQTDLLVSLLPSTPKTAGILDARRLRQLPAGAGGECGSRQPRRAAGPDRAAGFRSSERCLPRRVRTGAAAGRPSRLASPEDHCDTACRLFRRAACARTLRGRRDCQIRAGRGDPERVRSRSGVLRRARTLHTAYRRLTNTQ